MATARGPERSATGQAVVVGGRRIRLTHLGKVIYPETGTTKAEVIEYYSRVADVMLPHCRNRPVTRKRWVDGVGTPDRPGEVFFEKNLPRSAPDWIPAREIEHSDHTTRYPLVDDLATLVWMAQQSALELHVPQWRFGAGGTAMNPDRIVLDLDPGDGTGLAECAEVARLIRGILGGMGLDPVPVTSGSTGIHLYAALDGTWSSEEVSAVAHELARALETDHPALVVSDMRKALRTGKVLVDWSQNNAAKTTIAPYSLRGRARPTVAAPRTWDELEDPGLRQLDFREVLERVERVGDPLAAVEREVWRSDRDARLATYRSMRDPGKTPEPMGGAATDGAPLGEEPVGGTAAGVGPGSGDSFVIHEHHATRLHYDVRLERDGVLVSWAVPNGIPDDPGRNHLAVRTEDHPLEYGLFEGTIPAGGYGAGEVAIWDRGRYDLEKWRDDEVIATIHGEKHGSHRLAFIRTEGKNWLLHLMADQPRRGLRRGRTVVGGRTGGVGAVSPMLAHLGDAGSLASGDWTFEMKWDGYRAIAAVRDGRLDLRSRNGLDFAPAYPELAAIADAVEGDAVLDGEIVALDRRGRPDFGRLQQRSGLTSARDVDRARRSTPVRFFAFDVVEAAGRDLTALPYSERRRMLRDLVRDTDVVSVPPDAGHDVETAVAISRDLGLEGVVAKRSDSRYRVGRRSRDWIKIKHTRTQEVVVGGWRPGNGARADTFGSLLVGIPAETGLRYVGRVGSGFTDRDLADLRRTLDRIARATPPLTDVPAEEARDAHWVTPKLVGEVEYAEFTADGRMRAATWRGLRRDKSPGDVGRADAGPPALAEVSSVSTGRGPARVGTPKPDTEEPHAQA